MSRWFLLLFFVSATVINAWFVASTVKQSRSHLWSEKNGAESSSSPRRRPIRSPLRRQQPIETDASSSTFSDTTPTTPTLTAHEQALQDPALLSSTNFTSMIQSPALLRSIREMGMERLTRVQAETFLPILEGKSICARSKTGSGKTLAMLLPVLERLSKPKLTSLNYDDHCVLIIVPTRELALQFAEQAKELLVHGPSNINVVCLHGGGKSMAVDRRTLQAKYKEAGSGALILVATPGRLVDHISLETSKSRSNRNTLVKSILGSAKTLILDEADRLLLEGFQKEIRLISSQLPRPEKRQTLLFSATVPSKMTPLLEIILSKDFVQVDCTEGRGENDRLIRSFLRLPSMELYSSCLISILQQEMQKDPACYKVLVFFPTARLVRFYANLFNDALKVPVLEIHSRMSQSGRNKARTAFTQAKRGIMFTSDVSARGIDYSDVTLVIQLGAPLSKSLNTHRIGRTSRSGSLGSALLIVLPFESSYVGGIARKFGFSDGQSEYAFHGKDHMQQARVTIRNQDKLRNNAESAYFSFIAYYLEYGPKDLKAHEILSAAEALATEVGLTQLPPLSDRLKQDLDKR